MSFKQPKINTFKFRLITHFNQQGFTLIELLVVIIILGVLVAIAVPNLVKQIGKAREVEIQNVVGSVNRAQQAFHFQNQTFVQGTDDAASLNTLALSYDNRYIDTNNFNIIDNVTNATVAPENAEFNSDNTRAFSGAVFYSAGSYQAGACRSFNPALQIPPPVAPRDCGTNFVLQ